MAMNATRPWYLRLIGAGGEPVARERAGVATCPVSIESAIVDEVHRQLWRGGISTDSYEVKAMPALHGEQTVEDCWVIYVKLTRWNNRTLPAIAFLEPALRQQLRPLNLEICAVYWRMHPQVELKPAAPVS